MDIRNKFIKVIREYEDVNQQQYLDWVNKVSRKVDMADLDGNLRSDSTEPYTLKKMVRQLLANYIKQNECFTNASLVFKAMSGIEGVKVAYVLGFMVENGKKFGHAWNIINGKHYDFTARISEEMDNEYYQIAIIDDLNKIKSLPVFNPSGECENEEYDVDGMCSIYPYYKNNL
jgi:hypothetical protein